MAFNYDINLSTNKDRVRFAIQDTKDEEHFFEDEELNGLLTIYNNNVNRTTVECCYTLSALFASEADTENVGPYAVSYKSLSDRYLKIADIYRQKIYRTLKCYAGGITISDMDFNRLNTDIVQMAFNRNMMKNRRIGNAVRNIGGDFIV